LKRGLQRSSLRGIILIPNELCNNEIACEEQQNDFDFQNDLNFVETAAACFLLEGGGRVDNDGG
jgi:hypothetical protein